MVRGTKAVGGRRGGFINRDIKSFRKGEKYYKGPYQQWVDYIEPWKEN